jgi:hypothetical protein
MFERLFAAAHEPAYGTKPTYRDACYFVRFRCKADIAQRSPADRDLWLHDLEGDQPFCRRRSIRKQPLRLLLPSLGAGGPHFVRATASLMV